MLLVVTWAMVQTLRKGRKSFPPWHFCALTSRWLVQSRCEYASLILTYLMHSGCTFKRRTAKDEITQWQTRHRYKSLKIRHTGEVNRKTWSLLLPVWRTILIILFLSSCLISTLNTPFLLLFWASTLHFHTSASPARLTLLPTLNLFHHIRLKKKKNTDYPGSPWELPPLQCSFGDMLLQVGMVINFLEINFLLGSFPPHLASLHPRPPPPHWQNQ